MSWVSSGKWFYYTISNKLLFKRCAGIIPCRLTWRLHFQSATLQLWKRWHFTAENPMSVFNRVWSGDKPAVSQERFDVKKQNTQTIAKMEWGNMWRILQASKASEKRALVQMLLFWDLMDHTETAWRRHTPPLLNEVLDGFWCVVMQARVLCFTMCILLYFGATFSSKHQPLNKVKGYGEISLLQIIKCNS